MSIKRRGTTALAALAVGCLALAGCSTAGNGGGAKSSNDPITLAWEQEFYSYNNATAAANATANTVVLTQVIRGFWDFGPDGKLRPDSEYGTYKKVSDDPLTVEYQFNEKAVWSDGEKIDCDDFLLNWAAKSGKYSSKETDDSGNRVSGFSPASTTGYEDQEKPQCKAGDQKITVKYTKKFGDWESGAGSSAGDGGNMPAHIVGKIAGVTDVIGAIQNDKQDDIAKLAKAWNDGFMVKDKFDPALLPSSGPYKLESRQAGQSVTLVANDKWWGTKPKTSKVVFRVISAEQQAQALQNGEVQAISPQPQVDLVKQIKGIGDAVKVDTGSKYTYEHLDFNFNTEFKDPELRKAFAMCVPRQTIVDNLIKPMDSTAKITNSRYKFTFNPDYKDIVGASYTGDFDQPKVEDAKKIVDAKGKAGMKVRLGYKSPNPRRTAAVALIADSCKKAGFEVVDSPSANFFDNELPNGNFDVALFAWSGSPLVSGIASTFITGGGNNKGKYSNPQVDAWTAQAMAETDQTKQNELIKQIEKQLWTDLTTIPLFEHPGINAYSKNLAGIKFQPSQTEMPYNINEWGKS